MTPFCLQYRNVKVRPGDPSGYSLWGWRNLDASIGWTSFFEHTGTGNSFWLLLDAVAQRLGTKGETQ